MRCQVPDNKYTDTRPFALQHLRLQLRALFQLYTVDIPRPVLVHQVQASVHIPIFKAEDDHVHARLQVVTRSPIVILSVVDWQYSTCSLTSRILLICFSPLVESRVTILAVS